MMAVRVDVACCFDAAMALPAADYDEPLLLKKGAVLVSFLWPAQHKPLLEQLASRQATASACL